MTMSYQIGGNSEVKNYNWNEKSLEGLNNRFNLEEERVYKPEGRSIKTIQSQEQGKKVWRKTDSFFMKFSSFTEK